MHNKHVSNTLITSNAHKYGAFKKILLFDVFSFGVPLQKKILEKNVFQPTNEYRVHFNRDSVLTHYFMDEEIACTDGFRFILKSEISCVVALT